MLILCLRSCTFPFCPKWKQVETTHPYIICLCVFERSWKGLFLLSWAGKIQLNLSAQFLRCCLIVKVCFFPVKHKRRYIKNRKLIFCVQNSTNNTKTQYKTKTNLVWFCYFQNRTFTKTFYILLTEMQYYFETVSNSFTKKALKTTEICKLYNLFL